MEEQSNRASCAVCEVEGRQGGAVQQSILCSVRGGGMTGKSSPAEHPVQCAKWRDDREEQSSRASCAVCEVEGRQGGAVQQSIMCRREGSEEKGREGTKFWKMP